MRATQFDDALPEEFEDSERARMLWEDEESRQMSALRRQHEEPELARKRRTSTGSSRRLYTSASFNSKSLA